jgi:hypothetical protein
MVNKQCPVRGQNVDGKSSQHTADVRKGRNVDYE